MFNKEKSNSLAKAIFQSDENSIFAIKYRPEEADLLAHAYEHKNKFYGIARISTFSNMQPENVILNNIIEKEKVIDNLSSLEYPARYRIEDFMGHLVDIYIDPLTSAQYSQLDMTYGRKDIPEDVLSRLILKKMDGATVRDLLFFKTISVKRKIDEYLTLREIRDWEIKHQQNIQKLIESLKKTEPTKEKPIVMDLYGTDDVSFSVALATEEEALELMKKIEKIGHNVVIENMFS